MTSPYSLSAPNRAYDSTALGVHLPGPLLREVYEISGGFTIINYQGTCPPTATMKYQFHDAVASPSPGTWLPVVTKNLPLAQTNACGYKFFLGTDELNPIWSSATYNETDGSRMQMKMTLFDPTDPARTDTFYFGFDSRGAMENSAVNPADTFVCGPQMPYESGIYGWPASWGF